MQLKKLHVLKDRTLTYSLIFFFVIAVVVFAISLYFQPGLSTFNTIVLCGMALIGTAAVISGLNDSYDFISKLHGTENRQNPPAKESYDLFLNLEASAISEMFLNALGSPNSSEQFATAQFKAYQETWYALQKLKLAADALWTSANEKNMANFLAETENVKLAFGNSKLFIDKTHSEELDNLLYHFDAYGLGKAEVMRMYAAISGRGKLPKWGKGVRERVGKRISENGSIKRKYEQLLERILTSFREKLSGESDARAKLEDRVRRAQDRVSSNFTEK